jgi:hypothetical protein
MHLTRAMICMVAVVFAIVFKYVGQWLHWPSEYGFGGSLTQPPMRLGAFVVCLILLIFCTAVGTMILGRRWYLAGLMTATAGLAMWSVRGGTMTAVLFNADNSGAGGRVFLSLFGELVVFFGVIGGLWNLVWVNYSQLFSEPRDSKTSRVSAPRPLERIAAIYMFGGIGSVVWQQNRQKILKTATEHDARSSVLALLVQIVIMAILLLLLAVTPLKKQALTSVFLAGMVATAVAEYFFADRCTGRWYWLAPLIVGSFGYIAAFINPTGIETAELQGIFAPLARLLPLDYASMGCAGVLFGYWWMEPEEEERAAGDGETPDASGGPSAKASVPEAA